MQSAFTTKLISAIRFGHRHIAGITLLGVFVALAVTVLFMALTGADPATTTPASSRAASGESQEALKTEGLARRNTGNPAAGATIETSETSTDPHDALKEKLMIEHGMISTDLERRNTATHAVAAQEAVLSEEWHWFAQSYLNKQNTEVPARRQEELKDQWLLQRGMSGR